MPLVNLELGFNIAFNVSVQPGDILYYVPANTQVGGFNLNINNAAIIELGPIINILTTVVDPTVGDNSLQTIVVNIGDNVVAPTVGDFLFFSKDRQVNEASIIGYYGKFKFKNNSRQKAELFSATCDISVSS
tara:strand:- start:239 stop:634 length:396 start_codon:yes stop_codon:yes gene_type:complete